MTRRRAARLRVPAFAAAVAAALALAAPASAAPTIDPPAPAIETAAVTPGSGPVSVSVVVPITATAGTTGLIDAETLSTDTAVDGILSRQLDAVLGTNAAIALDPSIVASIRVLGTSAPTDAQDWLARLQSAPNEVFLLGYADADPAAALVAGDAAVLAPLDFSFAVDPADFGPAATPTPTPTDGTAAPDPAITGDPADPPVDGAPLPLPTTADILAWESTLPSIAWPAETTVTTDAVTALADAGYADVIVSSTAVSASPQALVGLGDLDGLVADAPLSDLVGQAVDASLPTLAPTLAQLGAALDAAAITSPGRTVVVALDRGWAADADPAQLTDVLATIDQRDSAQVVTLGEVIAGPRAEAQLVPVDDDDRAARVGALVTAEAAEREYLAIAEQHLVVEGPRRLALLALLGVGWHDPALDWSAATNAYLDRSLEIRTSVQIVQSTDIFVPGDSTDLPITLTNALPIPVTVFVTMVPLRPLLHVRDSRVEVTIQPDSSSQAKIPVQAIVNGDVTVRVTLTADDGSSVGSPRFVKVLLQAGWETAGTIVLGALVVVVFGGGLVRNIVKRRKLAAEPGDPAGD